jgi:hypothetical protein
MIPDQHIIMLKPGLDAHSSSSISDNKIKNLALENKIMNSVADKLKKLNASIIYTNKFTLGGFSVKVADPNKRDIQEIQDKNCNKQIITTSVRNS